MAIEITPKTEEPPSGFALTRELKLFARDHRPGNIIVGNTGLIILTGVQRQQPHGWEWHFVPDRRSTPPPDEDIRKRNRNLFGYALQGLHNWWNQFENWDNYSLSRQEQMSSITFPWMDRFLHRILGPGIYSSAMIDTTTYQGTINLPALKENPEIMATINQMSAEVFFQRPQMQFPAPERVTLG